MSTARSDLKLDPSDKEIASKNAQALLEREARVALTLDERHVEAFTAALDSAFHPNAALERALSQAKRKVRRA